jgi:small GTP-binding protein
MNLHGGVRIVQRLIQRITDLGAELAPTVAQSPSAVQVGIPSPGAVDHAFDWLCPLDRWVHQCLTEAATPRVIEWLIGQGVLWRALLADWRRQLEAGQDTAVLAQARVLLDQADLGSRWRGRSVAIIGLPNAGKSTIANRLAARAVSLVADLPGTTRDWVGQPISLQGWPVYLLDTAGLRTSGDPIEAEGVARAVEQSCGADVRLLVMDSSCPPMGSEHLLTDRVRLKSCDVVVYSKCDLSPARRRDGGEALVAEGVRTVYVSGLTGAGWSELEGALLQGLGFSALQDPKSLVFCAEIQMGIAHLAAALKTGHRAKVLAVLDESCPTHKTTR